MSSSQRFLQNVSAFESQAKRVIEDIARQKPNAQNVASLLETHWKIMHELVGRIDSLERKLEAVGNGPGSTGSMGSD